MRFLLIFTIINMAFYEFSLCNDWNYDTHGPDFWKVAYPKSCGTGHMQSPINVQTWMTIYNRRLKHIVFNNYDSYANWNFTNNGHTIVASKTDSNARPFIFGSDFNKLYYLNQFHFHWGYNDYQGSEHTINFNKYPLELHLVHKSSENETAVVAFLFQLSETNNTDFERLVNALEYNSEEFNSKTIMISLGSLLPLTNVLNTNGYYRYTGSLTTPPCTEGVIWTIFTTKINISSYQLKVFRNNTILANFRDFQQLNSRLVYKSFIGFKF